MKVISLFSGIGAFEKALDSLEIEYDLVAFNSIVVPVVERIIQNLVKASVLPSVNI